MNLIKQLRNIYSFLVNIKGYLAIYENKGRVTLIGEGHNFFPTSRVSLFCGSTKEDIILKDHSEVMGALSSFAHGKIVFGEWAKFGKGVISCVNSVEIGDDAAIADGVFIVDHNFHPVNPDDRRYMRHTPHGSIERFPMYSANAPIKIGKNVMIGSNVRVCKGVTIGDNSVIGANSVVTKDIPANCIAAGNPARVVKENIDKTTTPIFPLKK